MKDKKLISFVIPVFNEEVIIEQLTKKITKFINAHTKYAFEIILVENGSTDNSFKLLQQSATKNKAFKIIQLTKNIGCDGGIEAGMHYAKGDALIILMADLQEPLEIIDSFFEKWNQGYEIVYGIVKKRTAGFFRNFCSIIYYKVMNIFTNNMFPENASDFRLIDKKVYTVINLLKEKNKFLRGLIMWTGYRSIGVPFDRNKRFAGVSKANFISVLKVAMNGIFSFSYVPLRLVSITGAIITVVSFVMIIFYLYLYIYGAKTPGIMTIISLILFLFGMLFFALGIISEYLVRIYDEVKSRPTYIVKKQINIK